MLIIGEKINASIKAVGSALLNEDEEFLSRLALNQSEAGANFIDVNAGVGANVRNNAPAVMKWLIGLVQNATDTPVCIDSDDPFVIEAALGAYRGDTVMINSVNAEPERLDAIAPLAVRRQAFVIALVMKESGIPRTVHERLEAAEFIMNYLTAAGLAEDRIFFDPLVLPISVDTTQGLVTLETIRALKARYPRSQTIMGLSNISYGLPNRAAINRSFFLMAVSAGLDAAIMNPLDGKLMSLARVANMLTNRDPLCRSFIRAHRKGLLSD